MPEVKKVQSRVKSAKTEEIDVNKAMIEAATANTAKVMHLSYSCCSPLVVETNAALKSKERTQAECPGCREATNKMLEDFANSGLPSIPHWSGLMQGTTFSKKTSQASR